MITVQKLNQLRNVCMEEWYENGVSLKAACANSSGIVNSGITKLKKYFYWDYTLKTYVIE